MTHKDIFICHASEDKVAVARPLAEGLAARGLTVWLDEYELRIGDGLIRTVDRGLQHSTYGVVIISPAFLLKPWPQRELDGLTTRELAADRIVVLPIWHNVTAEDVREYSSTLADKVAGLTGGGLGSLIDAIVERVFDERDESQAAAKGSGPRPEKAKSGPWSEVVRIANTIGNGLIRRVLDWLKDRTTAIVLAFVVALLLLGGLDLFSRSYFVGVDRETVAIFRGPPSGLLWFDSRLVERKEGFLVQDLCSREREKVRKGVWRGSRSAVADYIAELRTRSPQISRGC